MGEFFEFTVIAFDTDIPQQSVTMSASLTDGSDLPDWLTFTTEPVIIDPGPGNAIGGTFQGVPLAEDVGTFDVRVTATDSAGASSMREFTIEVVEELENFAPQVNDLAFRVAPSAPDGTSVGTVLAFDRNVGDTLTYEITSGDELGAFAINSATGEITVADSGLLMDNTSEDLIVTVTDEMGASGTGEVLISVTELRSWLIINWRP